MSNSKKDRWTESETTHRIIKNNTKCQIKNTWPWWHTVAYDQKIKTLCQKEMNSQKRNTQNLNRKEENSNGLLLKSSFNCVLPHLLFFFFLSQSNVFFLYHSFPPCTSHSVRRKGSPSSSWRWRQRCYCRPVDTYHISRIAMTGWVMTWVVRRASLLKPVWKPVLNCQNLATWFSYTVIWRINSQVPEGSMIPSGTVVQHVKVHTWLY